MGSLPFRYPRVALLAIVLLGLGLRTWGITQNSMTHYDEFYYTQSGLDLWIVTSGAAGPALENLTAEDQTASPLNGLHPLLPFHAPPAYPILIALVHALVGGPWYPAGALVSAVLGSATIVLMYSFAKRLCRSEAAGLIAAALVALSDFHVVYSRMWLTDATFCFVFLLAMDLLARLFEGGRLWWAIPAGLAAGLCWNVKYNGWMPPAIGLAAWLVVVVRAKCSGRVGAWASGQVGKVARQQGSEATRQQGSEAGPRNSVAPSPSRRLAVSPPGLLRTGWALGFVAAAAFVLFLPWHSYIERYFEGGYATVSVHHASFSSPLLAWQRGGAVVEKSLGVARAWLLNARHLLESLPVFRHWGWCVALLGAVVGSGLWLGRPTAAPGEPGQRVRWGALRVRHVVLLATLWLCAALMGLAGMLFLAGIAGGLVCVARGRPVDVLVAAWLAAFLVLVPAYHAYARLLLPALPAALLALLRGWQCLVGEPDGARQHAAAQHTVAAGAAGGRCGVLAVTGLIVLLAGTLAAGRLDVAEMRGVWSTWSSRRSYRAFAREIAAKLPADALLLCRTQPPLWYALPREFKGLEDHPLPQPLRQNRPVYLVLDFYVHITPELLASIEAQPGRLDEVARVPNDLTPPARLNLLTRREFTQKMRVLAGAEVPAPEHEFLPPRLQHPGPDWIILYRMDAPPAP